MKTVSARLQLQQLRTWAFLSNRKVQILAALREQIKDDPTYHSIAARFEGMLVTHRLSNKMLTFVIQYVDLSCCVCGAPKVAYRVTIDGYCSKHKDLAGMRLGVYQRRLEARGQDHVEALAAREARDRNLYGRKGSSRLSRPVIRKADLT